MRYLKYFENNEVDIEDSIVSYLESQDIVSIDEMYRNIKSAKSELDEIISYFSDGFAYKFIYRKFYHSRFF